MQSRKPNKLDLSLAESKQRRAGLFKHKAGIQLFYMLNFASHVIISKRMQLLYFTCSTCLFAYQIRRSGIHTDSHVPVPCIKFTAAACSLFSGRSIRRKERATVDPRCAPCTRAKKTLTHYCKLVKILNPGLSSHTVDMSPLGF